jgi:hypothetical protein
VLRLSDPTVATLADPEAIGTILNDDAPRLIAEDATIVEGTRGETVLRYPVRLSKSTRHAVTIGYATYNGWASAPEDFVPVSGTLTLSPPDTLVSIPITIFPDSTEEGDERFGIDVWMMAGGDTQSVSRIVTLLNDDAPPSAWVENVTVAEGTGGSTLVAMLVRLSNPASSAVQVNLETRGGNATRGSDYLIMRGAVMVPPGALEAPFGVTVIGDGACESAEMVQVQFERIRANQVYQRGSGMITIQDDDCTTPTLVSLLRAEAASAGIELRWRFEDTEPRSVTIERAASMDGPWSAIAPERREDDGVQVALDRAVRPGTEYWYRLRVRNASGEEVTLGPLAASAAAVTASALGRIAPNPARGPVRVEFSVARPAPVRISVIDVQGREVARLVAGIHAPGSYVASWNGEDARGAATPGLYFVRCEIEGRTWTRRLVVAR